MHVFSLRSHPCRDALLRTLGSHRAWLGVDTAFSAFWTEKALLVLWMPLAAASLVLVQASGVSQPFPAYFEFEPDQTCMAPP